MRWNETFRVLHTGFREAIESRKPEGKCKIRKFHFLPPRKFQLDFHPARAADFDESAAGQSGETEGAELLKNRNDGVHAMGVYQNTGRRQAPNRWRAFAASITI